MAKLVVLSTPVPQDGGLSMTLVRSGQCIDGTRYAVADGMVSFFTGIVGIVSCLPNFCFGPEGWAVLTL